VIVVVEDPADGALTWNLAEIAETLKSLTEA
jgi:hypothetical protein